MVRGNHERINLGFFYFLQNLLVIKMRSITMKEYYKILGLDPSAEPEVVAATYGALAAKYGAPDSKAPHADERMNEINEAYDVLRDPMKRAEFDRMRASRRPGASLPLSLTGASSSYPHINEYGFEERQNPQDGGIGIFIPAGEFIMGSPQDVGNADEHPIRTVSIDAYWIYRYEVTNGQFNRFVVEAAYTAEGPWKKYGVPGREDHPVICITWNDAEAYCQWAGGRLPSEAEWEKASRGVDGRLYPWGNDWDRNKCNNAGTDSREYKASRAKIELRRGTTPVGLFPRGVSPYGCLDMAGNVWEWCQDFYDADYYRKAPPENPAGPLAGETRVFRGGAWNNDATTGFRCAYRTGSKPRMTDDLHGFRVCFTSFPL
jgi:formylglycine-generating enzyme